MAPYEALYGRRCRSPVGWFEASEVRILGTDLFQDALEKVKVIKERLRTTQSKQKSHADRKVRDVVHIVGEKFLLKISPMEGVLRFGKKVQLGGNLTYDVELVAILDQHARKLRSKSIIPVKVYWRGQLAGEATWEIE
ncbi:uncharacterized protein [Nicotiana tomentosiformis]|uniref:uncharacterized protein n=1 Tax=Nicotiana tomentosiformis TaxID=4098 RepID=UPI00388CB387